MTIQNNNNNLNYLIDSTFTIVNRLFVLPFERIEENNVKKDYRDSFSHYYIPKVQIKDFNVLIDGKNFFDLPVKNEEEAYEKNIEMSNNNDYMTGNLLDFAYYKENYRLIATDLSKQTKIKDPQQISFIVNLLNNSKNEYSRFATKKWNIIDSESNGNYSHKNPIKFLDKLVNRVKSL